MDFTVINGEVRVLALRPPSQARECEQNAVCGLLGHLSLGADGRRCSPGNPH